MNLVGKTEKNGSTLINLKCVFGGKTAVTEETVKRVEIVIVQLNSMQF
jgi:hypothetical protein